MIRPIEPGENPPVTGDQPTRIEGAERYERAAPGERVERVDRAELERRREAGEAAGAAGAGILIFGATAAWILGIIGASGVMPAFLVAVASICLAGGLFFKGAASAARVPVPIEQSGRSVLSFADLGVGTTVELVGGGAGVVLGIVALSHIVPAFLMTASAMVIGTTLLLAITRLAPVRGVTERAQGLVLSAIAFQIFTAAAGVVLGIVGSTGQHPATMANAAFIVMGGGAMFAGLAAAGFLGGEATRRRRERRRLQREHEATPA